MLREIRVRRWDEDGYLRGRARLRAPHRRAVWPYALHREAVSFNGRYGNYAPTLFDHLLYDASIHPLARVHRAGSWTGLDYMSDLTYTLFGDSWRQTAGLASRRGQDAAVLADGTARGRISVAAASDGEATRDAAVEADAGHRCPVPRVAYPGRRNHVEARVQN